MRTGLWDRQGANVAEKKCMAWSCFSVEKSSVFGHRMPHFAVILSAAEETNVCPLKLQVFVGSVDELTDELYR